MKKKIFLLALAVMSVLGLCVVLAAVHRYGDANNDEIVTAADITWVRSYIAAPDRQAFIDANPGFNMYGADANADGEVNAADVELLRRFLAVANPDDVRLGPPSENRYIAVTFDDGPANIYTALILDYFLYLNTRPEVLSGQIAPAHATFYVNGVQESWTPGFEPLMHRMVDEGHAVDNHSFSHMVMSGEPAAVRANIRQMEEIIVRIAGRNSFSLRPPYLQFGANMVGLDKYFNMPFMSAGIDPADYIATHSAESMAAMILYGPLVVREGAEFDCGCTLMCNLRTTRGPGDGEWWTRPLFEGAVGNDGWGAHGGNILFHDGGGSRQRTVDALPLFIPRMQEMGYVFVTVEEMYRRMGVTPCWFFDDRPPRLNEWAVPLGQPGGCIHNPPCAPLR